MVGGHPGSNQRSQADAREMKDSLCPQRANRLVGEARHVKKKKKRKKMVFPKV